MRRSAPLLLLGLVGCYAPVRDLTLGAVRPRAPFAAESAPEPPRYDLADSWAARPEREDGADHVPPGAPVTSDPPADCFFVHGTTWADRSGWNQPMAAEAPNRAVEEQVLPVQASAFNASCRVYAPRYRQAHLDAFLDPASGAAALDLAYGDVERAFDAFLGEIGDRPFLLAGHSQGSAHLLRLLESRVFGTPLADRLVAAWLPGWSVPEGLPVCDHPAATGCVVSWNTEGPNPRGQLVDLTGPGTMCVNPLTWRTDDAWGGRAVDLAYLPPRPPREGVVDARCQEGALEVTRPADRRFRNGFVVDAIVGRDVYHNVDYALFYGNIRENARARVDAWRAAHAAAPPR